MNRPLLTHRQSRVFCYLCDYIEEHGYAPTIRQIGDAAGLSSTSSVAYVLSRLEHKGYVIRLSGRQAIAIDPTHAGKILVSREDLIYALKLAGFSEADDDGPVARLARAAGLVS